MIFPEDIHLLPRPKKTRLLKSMFPLRDDLEPDDDLVKLFSSALEQKNFSDFTRQLRGQHTDQFRMVISHDLDWLNPQHPVSIANYFRKLINRHPWFDFKTLLNSNAILESIQRILDVETQYGVEPVYCIGANQSHTSGRYAIRYNLQSPLYNHLCELLNNSEIGLHSGYEAVEQEAVLIETAALGNRIHRPVRFHRSHYLKGKPDSLYTQLDNASVSFDLGWGAPDFPGFRYQLPGMFHPFHSIRKTSFRVRVIPLLLMDNSFFRQSPAVVMNRFREQLALQSAYGGTACLLFHPENFLIMPELMKYFTEILDICKQEGASFNLPA